MAKKSLVNENITASRVRTVDEHGEQVGILLTEKALELAKDRGLDLVQVAEEADPPVCRIMDFGKYKYKQKKRTQQSHGKQHSSQIKEVRLRMKTCEHDLNIKVRRARKFLEDGNKVLVNLLMRGREVVHKDLGQNVLVGFAEKLEDIAKVEQEPRTEGRRMTMSIVAK